MKKITVQVPLQQMTESYQPIACVIENVVQVPSHFFEQIRLHPMNENKYIKQYSGYMWYEGNTAHCVLFLDRDSNNGILMSEGCGSTRMSQFIPDAKRFVTAQEFSAAEYTIHDYLMRMTAEAAVRMQQGEGTLSFQNLAEDVLGFDFQSELCKAWIEHLQNREDVQSIKSVQKQIQPDIDVKPKSLHTLRFITPMSISALIEDTTNDGEPSDDDWEDIGLRDAVCCKDEINEFFRELIDEMGEPRGLFHDYDGNTAINEKVFSVIPSVEVIDGMLMSMLICQFSEPLTDTELEEFRSWWMGTDCCHHGKGEELYYIETEKFGYINLSLWDGYDEYRIEVEDLSSSDGSDEEESPEIRDVSM